MPLRKATASEIEFTKKCRTRVKEANFALLYGAGVKTLSSALRKADPSLGKYDSEKLAKKLIAFKRGKLNRETNQFSGGTDSIVFNAMEDIAMQYTPTLPGLGTKISEALRPSMANRDFMTGRKNFAIQGSGSEMLSTIICVIKYLINLYNLEAYFCVSIHDEIHYVVKDEDVELFLGVMNLAHFYTWNFFHERFGVKEFPWQRAFFDDINIRHCVCKEADESTKTISNPEEPLGKKVTAKECIDLGIFKKLEQRLNHGKTNSISKVHS